MHNEIHSAKDLANGISNEFKSFLSDVEDLVKQTTTLTGDDLARAKAKLAKESVGEATVALSDRARHAAQVTNDYVHEQPWKSITMGAAFGLLLGVVLCRR
jgi:ElaB/YqjD/DUF883 family membrane-anchored ribosome-binding protein